MKQYVRPRFRKLSDRETEVFWCSLRDARKINRHGDFVLLRELSFYNDAQTFLIGNGVAGFAIKDEELVSVHKNNKRAQETAVYHILPKLVRCAFKYGAKFGDCYGEFLANYYMKSGFIAVGKLDFDSLSDNPPDWKVDKFGKPNIYVLIRGVKNIAELDRLKKLNQIAGLEAVENNLPKFKTLEDATQYRMELYEKLKKFGYKKRLEYIQNLPIKK